MDAAWEQFINNIAATAGEDFIRENRGLTLDLRDDAHIQTTENFAEGKIATHNDKIDMQKRFDDWQSNFQRYEDGTIKTNADNPNYGGNKPEQKVLDKGARSNYDDANRPKGTKTTHIDHTISLGEQMRDADAHAHLEREDIKAFANSDKNLGELDAPANFSKGDKSMTEFLDTEREDGRKAADIYNIDEDELSERDRIAREEYEKVKEKGKQQSIETGKQSQKEEAIRITNKALRAVVMQILAEFVKEIIRKLILWFRKSKKSINNLLESIKSATINFVSNLKKHLFNASTTILTTVATAIFGPIVRTVRKAITMIKQGAKSLKEAFSYIKNPANKKKPTSTLLLEVGRIFVLGASAVGALALGEVIEKGLMTVPVFAFEIPLIGSLASLVGLLLGGLVMGIIGAIVLNLINKLIANKLKAESTKEIIEKQNAIHSIQQKQIFIAEKQVERTKTSVFSEIKEQHLFVEQQVKIAFENLPDESYDEIGENDIVITDNSYDIMQMQQELEELL